MNTSLISLIIPVRNASAVLPQCLESILSQSYQQFEILIQDGDSSDETKAVAEQYFQQDERIKFASEKDNGVYDAMNKALVRASGEWVMFLGADDTLFDEFVLEKFLKENLKQVQVAYGNVEIIGKVQWASNHKKFDGEFDLDKLLKRNICHQAIIYRRSNLICNLPVFNINYFISADWDLNLKLWSNKPFKYIDMVISKFSAGGISSGVREDRLFKRDFKANIFRYFGLNIYLKYMYKILVYKISKIHI
jgi:glycosyltransferase involved in cell wall biosynthesis